MLSAVPRMWRWLIGGLVTLDLLYWFASEFGESRLGLPRFQVHAATSRLLRLSHFLVLFWLLSDGLMRPRLRRLFAPALPHQFASPALDALLGLVQILIAGAWFGYYFLLQTEPHPLVLYAFITFGFFVHITPLLITSWILEQMNHRIFKCRSGLLASLLGSERLHTAFAFLIALLLTVSGLLVTAQPPVIVPHDIFIESLPASLEGYRIALVTDVHIGPTVGRSKVERMVAMINAEMPDSVALVGDLVDGQMDALLPSLRPLAALRSKDGVLYVTGNHEYYHSSVDAWIAEIRKQGVTILRNSARLVRRSDAELCFAGVDDVSTLKTNIPGHRMDPAAALADCPARAIRVLLSHQPNGVAKALKLDPKLNVHLFLSGHTHGGQFYNIAPFAWLINSYFIGHYTGLGHQGTAQIYVSPGVHYGGPPMKMVGLSQIPVIRLRATHS